MGLIEWGLCRVGASSISTHRHLKERKSTLTVSALYNHRTIKMSQDEDLAGDPPASINPYEVLEVDEKATADEIKSAYRKKALKYHPGILHRIIYWL